MRIATAGQLPCCCFGFPFQLPFTMATTAQPRRHLLYESALCIRTPEATADTQSSKRWHNAVLSPGCSSVNITFTSCRAAGRGPNATANRRGHPDQTGTPQPFLICIHSLLHPCHVSRPTIWLALRKEISTQTPRHRRTFIHRLQGTNRGTNSFGDELDQRGVGSTCVQGSSDADTGKDCDGELPAHSVRRFSRLRVSGERSLVPHR